MNERIDPFAKLGGDLPSFAPKVRKTSAPAQETFDKLAEESGFQSRQPDRQQQKAGKRKPRIYRTGRNIQFNTKVTQETHDKIYRLADLKAVTIGELVEMAFNALERGD